MKSNTSMPSREDILYAFAVEADPGPKTLDCYVRKYPNYEAELRELAQELSEPITENTGPLSAKDQALIKAAWTRHQAAAPGARLDPFAALTVASLRAIATTLGIRRNVLMAFRERKVIVSSVPQPFLGHLASALGTSMDRLTRFLTLPAAQSALSYKAEEKPKETKPVTFEQVLIESGMPEPERAKLMAGK